MDQTASTPPSGGPSQSILPPAADGDEPAMPTEAEVAEVMAYPVDDTGTVRVPPGFYGREYPDTDHWVDRDGTVYDGDGNEVRTGGVE